MEYLYICKANGTGELFAMFGNFKDASNRPHRMFKRMCDDKPFCKQTPLHGNFCNVSAEGTVPNFRIVYQYAK